ncbi:MAG: CocE/NonD family hydrolase [Planctomycetota bacterium]|nr:CocE/NonD family hydrolase [Planctomycetota bacterium]
MRSIKLVLLLLPGLGLLAGEPAAKDLDRVLARLAPGTKHEFVMMPLRDGVKLATDIFYPPSGDGPWPVVLLRTPYSRFDPRGLSGLGDTPGVLVCQNQRGRFGSEGTLPKEHFENEPDDDYDAIEWIAKQKWCNGRVGTWGPSGHGVSSFNAIWSEAPHLKVVDVNVSGDCAWLHWFFSNGVRRDTYDWLSNRNQAVAEWPRPTVSAFDLARRAAFVKERAARCKIAFRGKGGWFDIFNEAMLDAYAALAHNGRCTVAISPAGHGQIGGFTFPSAPPLRGLPDFSFKQWLTEDESKAPGKSVLTYYLMGDGRKLNGPFGNVWKAAETWPVPSTPASYYLRAGGKLSTQAPDETDAVETYAYDPRKPCPTVGGHHFVGDKSGPLDQRALKERKDILRFATEPLAEPVGITGKVRVELHVETDVPDTVFVAKLVDVYPDGYEALIREAAFLARFHGGFDKPAPLEKGKVYVLDMDLWSTALVFNPGHRIAVHVSSSSTPAYEVHPNTYEPVMTFDASPIANQRIHVSSAHPSRLILPMIPKESYAK